MLYLVNAGTATISLSGGKTLQLIVSGTNQYIKPYVDLILSWPSRVSGMSEMEVVDTTMRYIFSNYTYGANGTLPMPYTKIGSCDGGNGLFEDLCETVGVSVEVVGAKPGHGGDGHVVSKVMIDGVPYMVDASPFSEGWNITESQIKKRIYTWERYEELYGN